MAGLLDFFTGGSNASQQRMDNLGLGNSQPGGVYNRETYGLLGPQGPAPLTDEQRRSILFSSIADSFDSVRGINSDTTGQLSKQFRQDNAKDQADKRRSAINQAIQTAISQGDMQGARAAIMQADPQDVAHITSALNFGQPKIQDVGGAGYSIDPFTSKATQIISPRAKAPQTRTIQRGLNSVEQEFNEQTGQYADIPGAVGPKFSPHAEGGGGDANPFGRGMTGKAYAILAAGATDEAKRATPEYMTAYQILSRPHVDANTGTIVYPDISAYAPPAGMSAPGGQEQMPRIKAFAPPNPSQADAASAGYAKRLAEASDQIDQNEDPLSSLTQHSLAGVPGVGNYLVSPEYQKGDQAERNFINAQLRRESGAAIAESEFSNARKQYIPQPGDSKEVKAQKRQARATARRNMELSAGNTLLPPGVFQDAAPARGAPVVPMNQGFGAPTPQALPRTAPAASGGWSVKRRN